jgi:hypothetical protein
LRLPQATDESTGNRAEQGTAAGRSDILPAFLMNDAVQDLAFITLAGSFEGDIK